MADNAQNLHCFSEIDNYVNLYEKIKSLVIIIQKGAFNYILYLLLQGEEESIKWECMQKGGKGVIFMQTFTYNFF